jgi:hypothetical protein
MGHHSIPSLLKADAEEVELRIGRGRGHDHWVRQTVIELELGS